MWLLFVRYCACECICVFVFAGRQPCTNNVDMSGYRAAAEQRERIFQDVNERLKRLAAFYEAPLQHGSMKLHVVSSCEEIRAEGYKACASVYV